MMYRSVPREGAQLTQEEISSQRKVRVEGSLVLAIVSLGVTSMITQVVMLREFLSIFYGNELVIGVILASWMALTGIGAFLGKNSARLELKIPWIITLLVVLGLLPALLVFLIRSLRNVVFVYGTMMGILETLYSSFIILFPFCIISGFLFTLFAYTLSQLSRVNRTTMVYALESLGSVIGGLAFSLVLSSAMTTFQSLSIIFAVNCLVALAVSVRHGPRWIRFVLPVVGVLGLVAVWSFDIDGVTKSMMFRGQQIVYTADTPYGSLTITRQDNQVNVFDNNLLLFSTFDPALCEEAVHFAMVQHPHPRDVLLISGGLSGVIKEVQKYDVASIDYVELNPWLIEAGKKYTPFLANANLRVIVRDARLYVKESSKKYDIVLVNLPEPSTAQLNRVYTVEFLQELKKRLNDGAILTMSLPSSADYLSLEARQIRSTMYTTLHTVFPQVVIVPGLKDYFLASDRKVSTDIARMIEEKKIPTVYVNRYYIDDELVQQRSAYILSTLDTSAVLNEDFSPIAYYRHVVYWLSQFNVSPWAIVGVFALVLALLVGRLNPISAGMLTGGFAAASVEFLLLISFQIIYGYVYQLIGVIIAVFMAGLAAGAWFRKRILPAPTIGKYVSIQLLVAGYLLAFPYIVRALSAGSLSTTLVHSAFYLLAFFVALLVGAEFSLAAELRSGLVASVASELYGVDLIGSSVGALLIGAVLVPLFGIAKGCVAVALLCLCSAVIAYLNRKHYLPLRV